MGKLTNTHASSPHTYICTYICAHTYVFVMALSLDFLFYYATFCSCICCFFSVIALAAQKLKLIFVCLKVSGAFSASRKC